MELVAERRFQALKSRLDQLQYTQPLSFDSSPLVERLLNDLLKTSEGFQQIKAENKEYSNQISNFEKILDPLKRENNRLIKVNNDLHLEMMGVKEKADDNDNKWRCTVKTLESETGDFKFVIERLRSDVKRLETENYTLKTRLESAISATYLPSTQKGIIDPALKLQDMNTASNHQKFVTSKPMNDEAEETDRSTFLRENEDWANELRDADDRARKLQEALESVQGVQEESQTRVAALVTQVENRDKELKRLTDLLEDFPNMEKLTHSYIVTDSKDSVSNMNSKMDYLNNENTRLDSELTDANTKLDRVQYMFSENNQLQIEVQELKVKNSKLKTRIANLEVVEQQLDEFNLRDLNISKADLAEELVQARIAYENERSMKETVQLENKRLGDELQVTFTLQQTHQVEKGTLQESIDRLKEDKQRQGHELIESQGLSNRLQLELKSARDEVRLMEHKIENLSKEIEMSQGAVHKISKEHLDTTEEAYSLKQKIAVLENSKNLLQSELDNARFEIQRMSSLKQAAEQHLENYKSESLKAKTEADSQTSARQRIIVLNEGLQKEVDFLKEENKSISELRNQDRKAIQDADRSIADLQMQLVAAKDSQGAVGREVTILNDDLAKRLSEIRQLEAQNAANARELENLRPLEQRVEEYAIEIKALTSQTVGKDQASSQLLRQVEALEDQVGKLRNDNNLLNTQLKSAVGERNTLQESIDFLENEKVGAQAAMQRAESREASYNNLNGELERAREKEREYIRDIEKLRSDITREEDKATSLQRQLDHAIRSKEDSSIELDRARATYTASQSNEQETRSKVMRLEEQVFQLGLQLEDSKRAASLEQTERLRADDEISQLKRSIESEKAHSSRLNDQIISMKSLHESLEKSRDELVSKLQSSKAKQEDNSVAAGNQAEMINMLRKEVNDKMDEINRMNNKINEVDNDRDNVHKLLDAKTEQMSAMHSSINDYKSQIDRLQSQLLDAEKDVDSSKKKIDEKGGSISQLQFKISDLSNQLEESSLRQQSLYKENVQLTEHLTSRTRDAQTAQDELTRVTTDLSKLRQTYADLEASEQVARKLGKTQESEKLTLNETYQRTCDENTRMTASLAELSKQQREFSLQNSQLQEELDFSKSSLKAKEEMLANMETQVGSLTRNVTHLTEEVQKSDNRQIEVVAAKEEALKSLNTTKALHAGLEANSDDMQRKMVIFQNEKLLAETKTRGIESEMSGLKKALEYEQQKYGDLEHVLAKERANAYTIQLDFSKAEEERLRLRSEIEGMRLSSTGL